MGRAHFGHGYAAGTISQVSSDEGIFVELVVLEGRLRLKQLILTGVGSAQLPALETIGAGRNYHLRVPRA
jgi:hypothetical protein